MLKCKQHMNLSVGPWYSSCVNSVKTKNFLFNYILSRKKNVMSCRHEFEVAGIFVMAILNFFLVFLFVNYALIFVINHEAGNIAKVGNEMLLGSMLHMNSFVGVNLTYCNIPDSRFHSRSSLGCMQKQFEEYYVRRSTEIFSCMLSYILQSSNSNSMQFFNKKSKIAMVCDE